MTFSAIRHGRTEYNDLGLAQGSKDIPLSELGRAEVEAFRKELQGKAFKTILVSPLKRTIETAQILFPGRDFQIVDFLTERSFGDMEGKPRDLLPEEMDSFYATQLPYGIEPLVSVFERTKKALDLMEGMEEPIIWVTHGGVMNALFYLQYGIPKDGICTFQFRKNNELVEYHIGKEKSYEAIHCPSRGH